MKKPGPTIKAESQEAVGAGDRLRLWFPELGAARLQQLFDYLEEVNKANKNFGLLTSNAMKNVESSQLADCILGCRLITKSVTGSDPLYDFGTGAGLPGLIYAIIDQTRRIILVDKDQRKLDFCKQTAAKLGLKNVSTLAAIVEELPAGSVKYAVARSFAPFGRALLACRKPIAKGGRFFHMKSDGWANELAQMPSQLFTHWSPSLLGQYRLPETTTDMFVVMTEKNTD